MSTTKIEGVVIIGAAVLYFLILILSKLFGRKNKAGGINQEKLADFSREREKHFFFVESIEKEAGVCCARHIESGETLRYKIPLVGGGCKEVEPDEIYILSFDSSGLPVFLPRNTANLI